MTIAYQKGHKDVLCALFGVQFHSLDEAMTPTSRGNLGSGVLEATELTEESTMIENMTGELKGVTKQMLRMEHIQPGRGPCGAPELAEMQNLPSQEQSACVKRKEAKALLLQIAQSCPKNCIK